MFPVYTAAVGGERRAARLLRAATPGLSSTVLIYCNLLCDTARFLCV